ncbi:MAG TPA: TetR/AcrR family transcriptional regulator [Rhizobiales bacterium]|nr:TetR/AcrR family transcriptional regulator [Hyphomicrobiales bacterium]
MDQAAIPEIDPKRARVLEGAARVFLNYGFARTTMDDIARAAEMSRPALYCLFRNKTDIFRAIALSMLDQTVETMRRELEGDRPFAERMMAAIDKSFIAMTSLVNGSAHGAELLDMKNSLARDIVISWRGETSALLAGEIRKEALRLGVDLPSQGLSAEGLADLLLDGLEGLKGRIAAVDLQREAARAIVHAIERAIRP